MRTGRGQGRNEDDFPGNKDEDGTRTRQDEDEKF